MRLLEAAELAGLGATLREPRLREEYELLAIIARRSAGPAELLVALTVRGRLRSAATAPLWLRVLAEAAVANARPA